MPETEVPTSNTKCTRKVLGKKSKYAYLYSPPKYIHIQTSLFAQKFQYNPTKNKGTELNEKVVKH